MDSPDKTTEVAEAVVKVGIFLMLLPFLALSVIVGVILISIGAGM